MLSTIGKCRRTHHIIELFVDVIGSGGVVAAVAVAVAGVAATDAAGTATGNAATAHHCTGSVKKLIS